VGGSTLYLPITVDGAMVCLGDGHAAQGDGEVGGTAIECPMTTTVRFELLEQGSVSGIYAETPAGFVTFGFDADLNVATTQALDAMLEWMSTKFGLAKTDALALASIAVDLRITQIANQTWGVHALLSSRTSAGR
jgi:acetamidase/formamidase